MYGLLAIPLYLGYILAAILVDDLRVLHWVVFFLNAWLFLQWLSSTQGLEVLWSCTLFTFWYIGHYLQLVVWFEPFACSYRYGLSSISLPLLLVATAIACVLHPLGLVPRASYQKMQSAAIPESWADAYWRSARQKDALNGVVQRASGWLLAAVAVVWSTAFAIALATAVAVSASDSLLQNPACAIQDIGQSWYPWVYVYVLMATLFAIFAWQILSGHVRKQHSWNTILYLGLSCLAFLQWASFSLAVSIDGGIWSTMHSRLQNVMMAISLLGGISYWASLLFQTAVPRNISQVTLGLASTKLSTQPIDLRGVVTVVLFYAGLLSLTFFVFWQRSVSWFVLICTSTLQVLLLATLLTVGRKYEDTWGMHLFAFEPWTLVHFIMGVLAAMSGWPLVWFVLAILLWEVAEVFASRGQLPEIRDNQMLDVVIALLGWLLVFAMDDTAKGALLSPWAGA